MTAEQPTLGEVDRLVAARVLASHRINYHQRNVGGETSSTLRYTSCDGCDWLGGWHDEHGWEYHVAAELARLLADAEQRGREAGVNEGIRLAAHLVRDHVIGETGERVAAFLTARADRIARGADT